MGLSEGVIDPKFPGVGERELANSFGLTEREEVSSPPREWNLAYFDLFAHCLPPLTASEVERLTLTPMCSLPEDSFFEVAPAFLRSVDDVYFNDRGVEESIAPHRCQKRRRIIGKASFEAERPYEPPEERFNHQMGALWLRGARVLVSAGAQPWVFTLVQAYADWTWVRHKCRLVPSAVRCERLEQRRSLPTVVAVHQCVHECSLIQLLFRRWTAGERIDQGVPNDVRQSRLVDRAREQHAAKGAAKMLDAALSGLRGLCSRHEDRQMAGKR